jgi:cytochrome P450 family 6
MTFDKFFTSMKVLFVNSCQSFSRKLGLMFNDKEAAEFFLNVFKNTIKFREENEIEKHDFAHLLLQLKRNVNLEINEMAAESFTFYFGGFHTTATLMSFILYELALNTNVQDELRSEIENISDDNISYDKLMSLKYDSK